MTTASLEHDPGPFFAQCASPLALVAKDGCVVRGNDAFARALSKDGNVAGRHLASLFREADRARVQAAVEAAAPGAPVAFDAVPLETAAGSIVRSIRFHVTCAAGGTLMLAAVPPPVRRSDDEIEHALREQLSIVDKQRHEIEMLAQIINKAPLVFWAVDANGTFTTSWGGGLASLGLRPGEAVGQSAFDLYRDLPQIAGAVVRAIAGEELRMTVNPVPDMYLDSWYLPLRGPDGSPHGAVGLALDVSERLRSERELREKLDVIERQSAAIRALATPIIKVWDEVLCLPVVGTVDSARTAEMMQALLEAISREQARFAIVDLTGVEVVDTSTADHLIQLFRAAKVLGVDGILCGMRPAVAQTVVALGLELGSVKTMRSLRDALRWCIRSLGQPQANGAGGKPAPKGARPPAAPNGTSAPAREEQS